jgi:hypothetical protein
MATTNTEAAAVKAARATKPKTALKPDPTGNVTGRTHAPVVGVNEPPRNYFMLGDPDEPRAVIEAAGGNYGPILGDDYVVAPEDAFESFVPFRCTSSVTRQRWCTGQHVPVEVFFTHYGEEKARELIAAAEAARQPVAALAPAPEAGGDEGKQPENPTA